MRAASGAHAPRAHSRPLRTGARAHYEPPPPPEGIAHARRSLAPHLRAARRPPPRRERFDFLIGSPPANRGAGWVEVCLATRKAARLLAESAERLPRPLPAAARPPPFCEGSSGGWRAAGLSPGAAPSLQRDPRRRTRLLGSRGEAKEPRGGENGARSAAGGLVRRG